MVPTLAIVVSYNPSAEIVHSAEQLLKQVERVVVVDNGSTKHAREALNSIQDQNVTYIFLN